MADLQTRESTSQGAEAMAEHSRVIACDVPPSVLARLRRAPGAEVLPESATELTARKIADLRPDVVVAPLFGPVMDVWELGEFLDRIGYGGTLAVLTPPLPDPGIVRDELSAALPGLKVQLVALPVLAAA